jgi:beta-lactamase regulating signal transducer with metallopeptidase domain
MSELFQQVNNHWLGYFSLTIIQNSLFLLLIFALLKIYHNAVAQVKYYICFVGVIKLLLPPFIPYKLSSQLLDSYFSANITQGDLLESIKSTVDQPVNGVASISMGLDWGELIFLMWIAGVLISLFISSFGVFKIALSLRNSVKIDKSEYSDFFSSEKISVYISPRIPLPITIAIFPNRIFVPVAWSEWNDQCRKIVLNHEQVHLVKHDNFLQLVQVLAQALFFFHPLVYFLNKKMNLYREMTCDDNVVRNGKSTHLEYSKCLTDIAEKAIWKTTTWRTVTTFINQKSDLSHRITYQMKEDTMSIISKKINLIIVLLPLLLIPVFSWYVSSAEAKSPIAAKVNSNLIEIRVYSEQDIKIEGKKTSINEFEKTVVDIAKEYDDPLINLEFDKNVGMPLVFKIQRILRENDLLKVRYSDDDVRVLNLHLPNTATEEQLKKIASSDVLTLNIISTGEIQTKDITLDISELEKLLRDSHAENEYLIVSVTAENDVIYKDFIIVLEEIRKSESKRVLIYENID